MIIEKSEVTEGGKTFNALTHSSKFYAVGYDQNKMVKLYTIEEEPLSGGTYIGSMLDGFGATDWAEFMLEIENRGLIMPPQQ